jgi:hypothetical protein
MAGAALRLLFLVCSAGLLIGPLAAQTVTVTNVPENGYSYNYFPGDCPSGYNIPAGQYPSSNHLEREHVIYNHTTDQWVLYAHYDDSSYTIAEVLVATSSSECGPYTVQSEFQPLGLQSRDENIFEDDDGSAYLISASNKDGGANDTMAIFKLTSDYLSVDASAGNIWLYEYGYREAPAVAKSNGTYFLTTSQAAGWFPSQGGYSSSQAMMSGWSALENLGNSSTFGGQASDLLTIKGTSATSYVLVLDHLGGNTLRDTGSMWLPLFLNGSAATATLNWYSSWQINMKTGALTLPGNPDVALGQPATAISSQTANPPQLASDGNYATEWVSASGFPAWWMTDLGTPTPIEEVDVSWWMYKGSEAYYQYTIDYSNDGVNFQSIDRTGNLFYGFTSDQVNFTARYVRITLDNAVLWNCGCDWYTPQLYEVQLLGAPQGPPSPSPTSIQVTPSAASIMINQLVTFTATVSGAATGCAVPTGTVTLSGGGYTSPAFALLSSAAQPPNPPGCPPGAATAVATVTIPGGALPPGINNFTATYTPGLLSFATYQASSAQTSVNVNGGGPGGGYLIPDGTYTFTNLNSGLVMDDPNSSTSEGTFLDQAVATGGTNQQWQVTNVGDNNVKIINVSSGLAVDVFAQSTSPGGQIDEWPWDGDANQQWSITPLSGGGYEINSLLSGLTLEVPGQSTTAGTTLDQGTWTGGTNQEWTVTTVPTSVTRTGDGQLTVSWPAAETPGTTYSLSRSTNGQAYATIAIALTATTYVDSGLVDFSNVYCYVITPVFDNVPGAGSTAVCNTAGTALVVPDFSFETPATGSYEYTPTGAPWTFSASPDGSGVAANGSGFTYANANAPDGVQVAFLQRNATVTQTIGGFTVGKTYQVVVAASQRQTYNNGGNPFNINVNGTTIASFDPPEGVPTYSDYSGTFTAANASETIQFAGTDALAPGADNTVLIDNVRINGDGIAALSLTVQPAYIAQGASVAILSATATFSGAVPTSPMIFSVDGGYQVPGTCSTNSTAETCTVAYSTASGLTAGNHVVTVRYPGDATYAAATATGTLGVGDSSIVQTQLAATSLVWPGSTNLTACITSATHVTPTGSVEVFDGSTPLTTQTVQGGGCAYWYIAPSLNAGTHSITTVYFGDSHNPGGTSSPVAVTVSPAPVTLAVSCWNASFSYGGSYTCQANLSSNGGAPGGNLTYTVDGGSPVTMALNGGEAQFTVPTPSVGSHTVVLSYAAQGNFAAAGPVTERFTVTQ